METLKCGITEYTAWKHYLTYTMSALLCIFISTTLRWFSKKYRPISCYSVSCGSGSRVGSGSGPAFFLCFNLQETNAEAQPAAMDVEGGRSLCALLAAWKPKFSCVIKQKWFQDFRSYPLINEFYTGWVRSRQNFILLRSRYHCALTFDSLSKIHFISLIS